MEIPDLVREELGDEEILDGVSIGDEDVVCSTPTRTLVYRSEGLLSDERIDSFPHDADRLELSEGRRKTKFTLTYVDGSASFAVPGNSTRKVLTVLLQGILGASGVIENGESVAGSFRFSEMTLVITEQRLIRHIGATVWQDDFETYEYENLTGLDFEEGNVATEIVISIDGRPNRIKTPREDARLVESTLKTAVFEYYDVRSLDELDRLVGTTDDEESEDEDPFAFGSDIDPLVTDTGSDDPTVEGANDVTERTASKNEPGPVGTESSATEAEDAVLDTQDGSVQPESTASETESAAREDHGRADNVGDNTVKGEGDIDPTEDNISEWGSPDRVSQDKRHSSRQSPSGQADAEKSVTESTRGTADQSGTAASDDPPREPDPDVATREAVVALDERVGDLTEAVKRQNQLLKKQHNAITELLKQLRSQ